MAKKQVAVSLRKPPSPEKADAFVAGGEGGKAAVDAVRSRPAAEQRAHDGEKPVEARQERERAQEAPQDRAPEARPGAEPPAATAPQAASAAAGPQALATTSEPHAGPPVLLGNDGRSRRAVTVYLPDPLADRLLLHCIENDRDMSNLVGEAVEVHLDKRLGPASVSAASAEAAAPREAPPPSASYRTEPFRPADTGPKGRVGRVVQVGRVLMTLWRQRPRAS
ncbi:hypothetical protein WMF27_39060 [Sorangium sp. So ce281]|uniref:hypothetical protein n=1 Tax=unclassified Sorangium TaxID=2621164 RepID=UPI003F5E105B